MAYGFEVSTSDGVKNTFVLTTGRLIRLYNGTSVTGSAVISEFDSSKGEYFYIQKTYSLYEQIFTWDNSTKTLTWRNIIALFMALPLTLHILRIFMWPFSIISRLDIKWHMARRY